MGTTQTVQAFIQIKEVTLDIQKHASEYNTDPSKIDTFAIEHAPLVLIGFTFA